MHLRSEEDSVLPNRDSQVCQEPARKKRSLVDRILNVAIMTLAVIALFFSVLPFFGNKLYASQQNFNFGPVRSGSVVRHTFTVQNRYLWPVTIASVHGDCGCTQYFTNRKLPLRLAPFESMEVVAELTTAGRRGNLVQEAVVATSDNRDKLLLSLSGKID
jgi:hypothetical protein